MIKSKMLASVILGGVIVLGASVAYGAWSAYGAQKEFEADGYILGEVTDEAQEETDGGYYFTAGDKYKKKYPEKIVFTDQEGDKTITDRENFVHYMNEDLSSFVKGVFIDLDDLNGKGISYYNISEGVVARKQGDEYIFQSTDKEMRLKNFIWKISDSKYIVVSEKLKLHLSEGNDQEVDGYIELHYYDKGIVRLVHQTGTYQTIASEASVTVANGMTLNLADKTVYSGEEEKFSIAGMVIDSDDNIEIVEKTEEALAKEEPEEKTDDQEADADEGAGSSSVNNSSSSSSSNSSVSNNNSAVVAGGDSGGSGNAGSGGDSGTDVPMEEETEVTFPVFEVTEFNCDLVNMNANILITDDDGVLEGPTTLKVVEAGTNKTVFQPSPYEQGVYDLSIATGNLEPDKEYILIANADYKYKDEIYNRDFVSKVFRTDDVGITIEKDYVTEDTLSLKVNVANYSAVTDASLSVCTSDGTPVRTEAINIQQAKEKPGEYRLEFDGLTSNTTYEVKLENLTCEGIAVQVEGQSQSFMTLKKTPTIGQAVAEKNIQTSTFNCYIKGVGNEKGVVDPDGGIVNYRYELYPTDLASGGDTANTPAGEPAKVITKSDASGATFQVDGAEVMRKTIYVYRLVAEFHDNETVRELYSGYSNWVSMDTEVYPYVEFTPTKDENGNEIGINWESASGSIVIRDMGNMVKPQELTASISGSDGIPPRTIPLQYESSEKSIPFKITGLKADMNYSVSISGTVDLGDDDEDKDKLRYIGGFSFKTLPKAPSVAVNVNALNQDMKQAFDVSFQLGALDGEDSARAVSAMNSVKLTLYPEEDINSPIHEGTIYLENHNQPDESMKDNYDYMSTMKADYYDQSIILTPKFFNRNNEDYTKASYYTLVVESGVDYTTHSNPIRMVNPAEPEAEVCKFRIDPHGFVPDMPDSRNNAIKVTTIRNSDLETDKQNPELSAGTIVGLTVDASRGSFPESGMRYAKKVTYKAYKITGGYDGEDLYQDGMTEEEVASVTLDVPAEATSLPTYNFEVGPEEGKLPRGYVYYFTYEVELDLRRDEGAESIKAVYPQDAEGWEGDILRSMLIQCPKETPMFYSYLYDTVESGDGYDLTWKYRYRDVDAAFTAGDFVSDNGTASGYEEGLGKEDTEEMTVTGATTGDVTITKEMRLYEEPAEYNGGNDTDTVLVKHKLSEDMGEQLKKLQYVAEAGSSKLMIHFPGADPSLLSQIAGIKITVEPKDGSVEAQVFDYIPVTGGMAGISLLDIADMRGKPLSVKVEAYYDGVLAGYAQAQDKDGKPQMLMLQQYTRDGGYTYEGGSAEASGSLHQFQELPDDEKMFDQAGGELAGFQFHNTEAVLAYKGKSRNYPFRVDRQGINTSRTGTSPATDAYYILKKAEKTELTYDGEEVQFEYIYPTVSKVNMTPGITDAELTFHYDGAHASEIENGTLYMKFTDDTGHVLENPDGTPARSYEIKVDKNGEYTLPNIGGEDAEEGWKDPFGALDPGETYYFVLEFKFTGDSKWHRVLDADNENIEQVYLFQTADQVKFQQMASDYDYENVSYENKNMRFAFKPDILTGYTLHFTLEASDGTSIPLGERYETMSSFREGENTLRLPVGYDETRHPIEGRDLLVYGETYTLKAVATTAAGDRVGGFEIEAPLKKFEDPFVSSFQTAGRDKIHYTVTVASQDFSMVDNQFTIRIWETEASPEEGGELLCDSTYELNQVDEKYSPSKVVEIDTKKDLDKTLKPNTSYTLEVSAKVDTYYKGADYQGEGAAKEFKKTFVTKTLNEAGVGFGTITGSIVDGSDSKKHIQLNLYSLVGSGNIGSVDYTVYNKGIGMVLSETNEKVTFKDGGEASGQTLHQLQLKADASGLPSGLYQVTIDFKDKNGNLIERKNVEFDYTTNKLLAAVQKLFR